MTRGAFGKDSVLNVDAQKEIIEYSAKVRTRQAIKMFIVILPIIGIFICLLLYGAYRISGVIK